MRFSEYLISELRTMGKFAKLVDVKVTNETITVFIERPKYMNKFPGYDTIRVLAETYFAKYVKDGKPKIKVAAVDTTKKRTKLTTDKTQDGILIR